MPIFFMRIAAKGETMYSSKTLSNASFVWPACFESETISSDLDLNPSSRSEDEMSSLTGIPFISENFSTFLTCSLCIIFSVFPSYSVFCYPYPCVVVLQIVSLGFVCFLGLGELTWSSNCSADFETTAEAWIPFCYLF